jgi:hypothetical protein
MDHNTNTNPIIPIHILIHIAELSIPTYRCMLAILSVARHFKNQQQQQYIQKYFTIIKNDEYRLNGKSHRIDDKPAVIHVDGIQIWYQNGKWHRDNDKSAIIYTDGEQHWCQHDKLHRDDDKPVVIKADGTQE